MLLTRLEFLRLTAAAAAGWLMQDRHEGRERAARIIEAYDAQGIHRTATDVDDRSADWLLNGARRAGSEARLEPFDLQRVDLRACSVRAGSRSIDGLPLFDGSFTSDRGVEGRLGEPESDAEIALVDVQQAGISSEGRVLAELRRSGRRAIVAVMHGASPGLSPMNAADFTRPYGIPVVQVSSRESEWLRQLAAAGDRVTVTAHAGRVADRAMNVVATVAGSRGDLPPLVVMTPRSGWWNCASERGGGIACWLEAIRRCAGQYGGAGVSAPPGSTRSVLFVASSGHELGHLGLESFIEHRADLVKGAAAWIHLGANIGAAGGRMRLQSSDAGIEGIANEALARAGASVAQRVPRGTVPAGEARNIHVGGGRYVSLLGTGPRFHNPDDRWPDAVDQAAVARFAAAVGGLAVTLARA